LVREVAQAMGRSAVGAPATSGSKVWLAKILDGVEVAPAGDAGDDLEGGLALAGGDGAADGRRQAGGGDAGSSARR
jgi:hypothetical protein